MAAIGIALILLVLIGQHIGPAMASAYSFAKARVSTFSNPLAITVELPLWKILLLLAAFWLIAGGGGVALPAWPGWRAWKLPSFVTPGKPLVVILYEADHGEPPAYASGAVNALRAEGYQVRITDDDPANGTNEVPAEIAPAIEPGRKIMGGTDGKDYALVLLRGKSVVKAEKLPASKELIMEAAK